MVEKFDSAIEAILADIEKKLADSSGESLAKKAEAVASLMSARMYVVCK